MNLRGAGGIDNRQTLRAVDCEWARGNLCVVNPKATGALWTVDNHVRFYCALVVVDHA